MKGEVVEKARKQGVHGQTSGHERGVIVAKTAPLIASAVLMTLWGEGHRGEGGDHRAAVCIKFQNKTG